MHATYLMYCTCELVVQYGYMGVGVGISSPLADQLEGTEDGRCAPTRLVYFGYCVSGLSRTLIGSITGSAWLT